MTMSMLSRRNLLQAGATGIAMLAAGRATTAGEPAAAQGGAKKGGAGKERWLLSLNMSTIRPASLEDKVAAAQKAGYDAVELWSDDLDKYEKAGKSLEDLAKRIKDGGMYVVNIIGIWNSMPQDDAGKAKLMEEARRKLAHAQKVGAQHIAAIPAPDRPEFNVLWAAGRYREFVDLGKEFNVKVAVEFVSFFQGIHTLGQAAAIAMESERPEASVVADTFHMHNGHSAWSGVGLVAGPLYAGAREDEGLGPHLPRRRHPAAGAALPDAVEERVPGAAVARDVQRGGVQETRRRGGEDGHREDAGGDCEGGGGNVKIADCELRIAD
jgi:hypothetical protein